MKPSNFRTRTLTAIIFLALMIASILSGALFFAILMFVVCYLGMKEFYRLTVPNTSKKSKIVGMAIGLMLYTLIFVYHYACLPGVYLWAFPTLLFFPLLIAIFDKGKHTIATVGATLAGIAFIAVPLSLLASLILLGDKLQGISGSEFVLMFLVILWIYDSAAYLIGSLIGKHKLYVRLSPGKTWEGILGGIVFGILAAWGISTVYTQIPLFHWLGIALITMVLGTLGDLCESMLKRHAGVKDSGKLLPGHGGILDRFDAVLMSAPAIYLYIVLFLV